MIIELFKRSKERKKRKMNEMTIRKERYEQIENLVSSKIEEHDLCRPSFDLIKFLKEKEGFEIVLQSMPDDTTGLIIMNDNEPIQNTNLKKLIAINSSLQSDPDYIQRRRFIIAHEYAHSQLHKQNSVLFAHRDTKKKETDAEQEADCFARCLLMPRKLMYPIVTDEKFQQLNEHEKERYISRVFNVTEKKARQRLTDLTNYA